MGVAERRQLFQRPQNIEDDAPPPPPPPPRRPAQRVLQQQQHLLQVPQNQHHYSSPVVATTRQASSPTQQQQTTPRRSPRLAAQQASSPTPQQQTTTPRRSPRLAAQRAASPTTARRPPTTTTPRTTNATNFASIRDAYERLEEDAHRIKTPLAYRPHLVENVNALQEEREAYERQLSDKRQHSIDEKQKRIDKLNEGRTVAADPVYHERLAKRQRAYEQQLERLQNKEEALRRGSDEYTTEQLQFMREQLDRLPGDLLEMKRSVKDVARLLDPRRLHEKMTAKWEEQPLRAGTRSVHDLTQIIATKKSITKIS